MSLSSQHAPSKKNDKDLNSPDGNKKSYEVVCLRTGQVLLSIFRPEDRHPATVPCRIAQSVLHVWMVVEIIPQLVMLYEVGLHHFEQRIFALQPTHTP